MADLVALSKDGNIAILTINNPPVNALSPGVPEGIVAGLDQVRNDASIQAVVLIGGGRTFIAGADIREFGKMTSGLKKRDVGLHPILFAIEDFPKPVVCAIHGTAFGGGLETAMSCHYRVAVPTAQVGQPEVKLGLIPGAGGTQRLPRLAGVAKAAEMCASGEPVRAADAHKLGIVDQIVEGDLLAGAIAFARDLIANGKGARRTRERNDKLSDSQTTAALKALRDTLQKRARGLIAPFRAVDSVEAAATLPFEQGLQREKELFEECLFSDQSKALIHVFFGEREVAKIPGLPKDVALIPIKQAAVIGAGTMGGGIAMAYLNAGLPVILKEVDQSALDRGLATIKKNYAATVAKGKLTQAQMDERLARLSPVLTYDRFREADIVVEAVFEDMALKKKTFAELDGVTRPDAILASNTSTLDIDQIASATSRPGQVIGHHFFSPANVMRLLEIVRGKATRPEVIATSMNLAKTLAKVGVLVGNCRGFVGNRMYHPYQREAQFLVEEGATVEEVDRALVEFGMAMGPLAVGDLAGLDVGWRIRKEHKHLIPAGERQPLVADRLCEMGHFGQKTGAGWYKYQLPDRTPLPNPEVQALIEDAARRAGLTRRTITPEEIVDRTVYALVNEGAAILDEGIALRAVDIDIIYINGYGFPPFRGGPMKYADLVGLPKVLARIKEFEKTHGPWWKPAPLLERLVSANKTFADFDREKA
jgi:3-hydroxyacyl-CoA dehydrogenase